MSQKIISLDKGHGEDSDFFTAEMRHYKSNLYVEEIRRVYRRQLFGRKKLIGYEMWKNNKRVAFVEAGSQITLRFEQNNETTQV